MRMMNQTNGNMNVVCSNGHSNEIAPSRIDIYQGRVECIYSSKIDFCEYCEAPIDEGMIISEVNVLIGRE